MSDRVPQAGEEVLASSQAGERVLLVSNADGTENSARPHNDIPPMNPGINEQQYRNPNGEYTISLNTLTKSGANLLENITKSEALGCSDHKAQRILNAIDPKERENAMIRLVAEMLNEMTLTHLKTGAPYDEDGRKTLLAWYNNWEARQNLRKGWQGVFDTKFFGEVRYLELFAWNKLMDH